MSSLDPWMAVSGVGSEVPQPGTGLQQAQVERTDRDIEQGWRDVSGRDPLHVSDHPVLQILRELIQVAGQGVPGFGI